MQSDDHRTTGTRVTAAAGVAALYLAASYVGGVAYFLVALDFPNVTEPLDKIALFTRHLIGLQIAHLAIHVVFGFALTVLAWGLHERVRAGAPGLMRVATSVALVWGGLLVAVGMATNAGMETVVALAVDDPDRAVTVWLAVDAITTGLGGGNGEILGGLWTLLVSVAAWRARAIPVALSAVGAVAGAAGVASALPGATVLIAPFALLQIVWFVGVGIVLLRAPHAAQSDAAPRQAGAA
ncbi:MAG: DUF4386 family protein [Trueperaceae bacterium]|nr:DUF4386 family protein [Trueperaceae bacterium]